MVTQNNTGYSDTYIPHSRPSLGQTEAQAAARAIHSGHIAEGEVVARFEKTFAKKLGVQEAVAVSSGTAALHLALLAMDVGSGDEVIIPAPYWVSYPDMVKLADGQPAILNGTAENEYKITARQLQNTINENTRMLISESPTNPHLSIVDLPRFTAIGQRHGVETLIDATLAVADFSKIQ